MRFHFVLFYVCRLFLYFCIYFFKYFIFLVARGIKPSSTCFQVLSSSPTQGEAGDRAGVCLLAEDCPYELSLCFVLCLSFMFVFIIIIFLNIFHISGSPWN